MFDFAIRRQYVDINIPQLCDWDYTKSEEEAHIPFSDAELELLWSKRNVLYVDIILIMIYTGLRAY